MSRPPRLDAGVRVFDHRAVSRAEAQEGGRVHVGVGFRLARQTFVDRNQAVDHDREQTADSGGLEDADGIA